MSHPVAHHRATVYTRGASAVLHRDTALQRARARTIRGSWQMDSGNTPALCTAGLLSVN